MNIKIILRTHDKSNVHEDGRRRYCQEDKPTVTKKCVFSLVDSVYYAIQKNPTWKISFIWIDDHSTVDTIKHIENKFALAKIQYYRIDLENSGNNESMTRQINIAKNEYADLVYLVEDDYLHCETALHEMIHIYQLMRQTIQSEIAIHPFDDPDNYKLNFVEPSKIVLGDFRHWRTNTYSTFTFLCNPNIIRENWDDFYKMAYLYMTPFGEACNIHEGTTINKVWRDRVCLLSPIPSVALHMQYEEQKDKFIDWKLWWDKL